MIGYYSTSGLKMQKINNMYSDIEQIQTEVDTYYLKNNELPLLSFNINFVNSANPNDSSEYSVIDLAKLGNLRLNYGKEFENIKSSNQLGDYTDVYIINNSLYSLTFSSNLEVILPSVPPP